MTHSTGTHIILDGRSCEVDFSTLDIPSIEQYISTLLRDTGMTILGTLFHDFREPQGALTGIFLLGESHFSIHTFPEEGYINIDLYTCNMTRDYSIDSRSIIDALINYFQITTPTIRTITR